MKSMLWLWPCRFGLKVIRGVQHQFILPTGIRVRGRGGVVNAAFGIRNHVEHGLTLTARFDFQQLAANARRGATGNGIENVRGDNGHALTRSRPCRVCSWWQARSG